MSKKESVEWGNGKIKELKGAYHGFKESKLDIMETLREIFKPEFDWLDSKGAPLTPKIGTREKELYSNGEWLGRYGIVAGGLYLEEELDIGNAYRPIRGVLVGIRAKGRKRKHGRPKKYSKGLESRRISIVGHGSRVIEKLDTRLQKLYRLEEDIKRGVREVSKEEKEDLGRRLELIERLTRSISIGKRLGVCRFTSSESEYGVIGKNMKERYLVEKKVWTDLNKNTGKLIIKYVVKWEHIGKLKTWEKPGLCRFVNRTKGV